MELLVKSRASTFRGDYYSHGKQFIATLPIFKIDFENPAEVAKHQQIVEMVQNIMQLKEQIRNNVLGIELDDIEAEKSAQYGTTVICKDFFTYYQEEIEGQTQFDVIVGNPPFIRYQHFTEEYRKVAFALMNNHGFHPNRLTNIWLPFLVLASIFS